MTQSIEHLTLGLGSGHDLTGGEMEAPLGCALRGESAWRFSPSASPPPLMCTLFLSLKLIN